MTEFRQLTPDFHVAAQINQADVAELAASAFALIINNRPEDESADQTPGAEIAEQAGQLGLGYAAIPVTHAGFSMPQIEATKAAIASANGGKILAYCRSGTRSTLLWALTRAAEGADPDEIALIALGAGYDVSPIRAHLDVLAAAAR